jgi:HAD superfamily hydrolase (TIGR01509 family)
VSSVSSRFDLVIFDCDGVLVDSESLACVVHADVLTQFGYPIAADQVHERFLGRSAREARLEVETELGRVLPDDYTATLKATIDEVFGAKLQPIPHIAETLAILSQPVCVASSGTPTRIRSSLTTTGLLDRFDPHLFSALQVERGKPQPDLFLFAAAQMNAVPERCVVIEDSIPGVTAGIAAGMTVFGYHGGGHCSPTTAAALTAAGAHLVFDDMRQLPGLVARGALAGEPVGLA